MQHYQQICVFPQPHFHRAMVIKAIWKTKKRGVLIPHCLREGLKKQQKNSVIFHKAPDPPSPPPVEKNEKPKNGLHDMKRILYDMGPLTLVRWPL